MERLGSNYQPQIHDHDYAAAYLSTPLDSRGLIDASGRDFESLNGQWSFGADWYDTCLRSRWFLERERDVSGRPLPLDYDWEAWGTMTVPSCWNLEREELRYFEGSGVYTREFPYRLRSKGERAFLRFEGAQYRTTVFLNGVCLGTHSGGSTPFCTEITGVVRQDNRIIVVVDARRRHDRVPEENTDLFHYGGIYRDVLLFRTPPAFIRDWFLRLSPDRSFKSIAFDLRVLGAGPKEARLRIPDLGVELSVPVIDGRQACASLPALSCGRPVTAAVRRCPGVRRGPRAGPDRFPGNPGGRPGHHPQRRARVSQGHMCPRGPPRRRERRRTKRRFAPRSHTRKSSTPTISALRTTRMTPVLPALPTRKASSSGPRCRSTGPWTLRIPPSWPTPRTRSPSSSCGIETALPW